MTAQSRATLKTYFLRGLRPTQSNYSDLIDSFELVSGAATSFLPLTGGIMTGAIQLPGVPTSALAAATKGYVDAIVSAGGVIIGGSNTQVQYNNAGVLGGFTVSGDAASLATTGVFTLANTAVSAGTYVLATVTVDAKGRLTSAATGSASITAVKSVKQQIFSASGTYTPSAGMLYCIAEVLGAGGGGSGADTGAIAGMGGAAGGYGKSLITAATIGASQTVTIGAAGAASSAGNNPGGTGGTSSLGALLSSTGGTGGTAGNVVRIGVAGGLAIADIAVSGQRAPAVYATTVCGKGADSQYGIGGVERAVAGAGNAGIGFGMGGGGGFGTSAVAGAVGGGGYIVITEFCSV